jgi:hypothetical protein
MITVSQVVRRVLIASNIATSDINLDWCCILKIMPDGVGVRDNIFSVIDMEGMVGGRYASTSEVIMHPHIRIICRSVSYDMGYSKMLQSMSVLDTITDYSCVFDNDTITLHKTSRQSGILSGGLDSTMRRYTFTLDYEIVLR